MSPEENTIAQHACSSMHKRNHTKHLLHRTSSTPSAADATIAEAIAFSSTSTFSSSSMGSTTPHRKLYTIFLMHRSSYHSSA